MGGALIDLVGFDGLLEPLVFDCRRGTADDERGALAFLAGRIPGAFHLHLDDDLSAPLDEGVLGGRHPLPHPDDLQALMRRHGLTGGRPVVACDDVGNPYAARLWWMLRWLGHEATYVLDGGFAAWTAAGRPLESGVARTPAAGDWTARPQPGWTVDAAAAGRLGAEGRLVDCRSPARFRGEVEPLDPIAGHIPGAVNRFWRDQLDGEQRLIRAPEVPEGAALYCGSGVTACVVALALAAHEGHIPPLYPGSWSDWLARGGDVETSV